VWSAHHETKPPSFAVGDRRAAQRSSGGGLFSHGYSVSKERIDDDRSKFVPDGFKHSETPPPFILQRIVKDGDCYLLTEDASANQTGADLALLDDVREFLRAHPGSSGHKVEASFSKQADKVRKALDVGGRWRGSGSPRRDPARVDGVAHATVPADHLSRDLRAACLDKLRRTLPRSRS